MRERGDVRIREGAIVLFFECRSESAKEKVERRKDAVLPEMGIRYFIFERTGRESGHVLRHHDIRFATDFKERVEYVCRFRGFVNWHQWNDCPGVKADGQVRLDINQIPVSGRIGINRESFGSH